MDADNQLRHAIVELIQRYGVKHNMTVYQAIGLLEVVKRDLLKMLEQAQE